jgi:hypothetical protein
LTPGFYPGIFIFMSYTAFHQFHRISIGSAAEIALFLRDKPQGQIIVFNDSTGCQVDLDSSGTEDEIGLRYSDSLPPRGRGRPRLGVIAREVTLLPRHWDWLNSQPGGASVALRKLVDEGRRTSGDRDRIRSAQDAAYRFISALAGNLPGFEEATRALFAYDRRRFGDLIASWPEDVRDYAIKLAFADQGPGPA